MVSFRSAAKGRARDRRPGGPMRFVLAVICFALPMAALAQPASDAAVQRLLEVAQAERLVKGVQERQRMVMNSVLRQVEETRARQGKPLSPELQARMHEAAEKTRAAMAEELSWEKLRPLIAQVYRDSFSEEEIQGLIAFYESPTGRMFVERMPQVMERMTQVMAERIG